ETIFHNQGVKAKEHNPVSPLKGDEHNHGGANMRGEKIGISNRDFDMLDGFEMMRTTIENLKCADKKSQISKGVDNLGDRGQAECK
ncbi:hypothetical protein U1Q18_011259, partial [Sarracenia purpurea var. burkii]